MIFLIWVFYVVVSLQRTSNVTGIVAVGTAKWLKLSVLLHVSEQRRFRDTAEFTLRTLKPFPFVCVAQSVAFQRSFGFELFTTQIAEVTLLCVVSVHVSLQVTPAAARIVAHAADVWL